MDQLKKEGETNSGEKSHKTQTRRPEGDTPDNNDNREYKSKEKPLKGLDPFEDVFGKSKKKAPRKT